MNRYCPYTIIEASTLRHNALCPNERFEWVKLGVALRVLGYNENTFAALSWKDAKTQKLCARVWRDNRNMRMTEDDAKAFIIALAKQSGADMKQFLLSPDSIRKPRTSTKPIAKDDQITLPPKYIDMDEVIRSANHVEKSTLYKFLCRLFEEERVRAACEKYYVGANKEFGATPDYATSFPYISKDGNCIDVHLQPYEADGKRWKKENHQYCQNWLLAKKKQNDRRGVWCLFGEHLLGDNVIYPVAIVESEKTALIASMVAPDYIWMATGSVSNLNARRLAAVKHKDCYLFPDRDGVEEWSKRADRLRQEGFKVFLCRDYIERHAEEGSKEDLADIIIKSLSR